MQLCKKARQMQKLYISPTLSTPEINFSPEENIFLIRGTSSPEDVRAMYYPVNEWVKMFVNDILEEGTISYSPGNPLKLQIDLIYFNSSSAKFLYDIFSELKRLSQSDITVVIEWFYDKEDIDLKEAGLDIASLAGMEFTYIQKNK
jgi:SiaC family regulatory phosphoprotein